LHCGGTEKVDLRLKCAQRRAGAISSNYITIQASIFSKLVQLMPQLRAKCLCMPH